MTCPLIIARLAGGLGNQLFIYAAAAALAQARQARLMLDTTLSFKHDGYRRQYSLDAFQGPAACPKLPSVFCGVIGRTLRRLLMSLPSRFPGLPYYKEAQTGTFDSTLATRPLPARLYLEGYWQSEAYFAQAAPQVREHVKPVRAASPESAKLAASLNPETAVSLHIRRQIGLPPNTQGVAGPGNYLLSPDYYHESIRLMSSSIPHPQFVVFGDNPAWARNTLKLPVDRTLWIPEGRDDVEDLLLMAQCRHHIIANSSFSWWGAWLGETTSSHILAPGAGWVNRDSIPSRWHVVPIQAGTNQP